MIPFDPSLPHGRDCLDQPVNGQCICRPSKVTYPGVINLDEVTADTAALAHADRIISKGTLHSVSLDDDGTGHIDLADPEADTREPLYVLRDDDGSLSTMPVREWDAMFDPDLYCTITDANGTVIVTCKEDGTITGGSLPDEVDSLRKKLSRTDVWARTATAFAVTYIVLDLAINHWTL